MLPSIPPPIHHPRKGNMELQRTFDWAWISLYSSLDNKETSLSRVLNSNYLPCQIIRLSIRNQKSTSTINPDQIWFTILWEKYTWTDLILEEFLALTILELWTSLFEQDILLLVWQESIMGTCKYVPRFPYNFIIKILSTPNCKCKITKNLIEASRK